MTNVIDSANIKMSQKWDGREVIKLGMSKLRGKMAEAGYTQRSLASAIGISANSLNDKINQKRPFNTVEIENICKVLKITDSSEKANIFLA